MPLVSVVIPTHNRPDMVAEALASVTAQTVRDYEIIVVSNGENRQMRARSSDAASRCGARYYALDRGNLSAARNYGIERAKGEWIAFLDDDDLWLPHKLERQLAAAAETGADLIASDFVETYQDGHRVTRDNRLNGLPPVAAMSRHLWFPSPVTVLVKKVAIKAIGGFNPHFRRGGEDLDAFRRISWRHTIHQVEEVLVEVRRGHPSATQNALACRCAELRHMVRMHFDTPADLRWALPRVRSLIWSRLRPDWLTRVRYRLRIRTRINDLRYRLRIRTRLRQWLAS